MLGEKRALYGSRQSSTATPEGTSQATTERKYAASEYSELLRKALIRQDQKNVERLERDLGLDTAALLAQERAYGGIPESSLYEDATQFGVEPATLREVLELHNGPSLEEQLRLFERHGCLPDASLLSNRTREVYLSQLEPPLRDAFGPLDVKRYAENNNIHNGRPAFDILREREPGRFWKGAKKGERLVSAEVVTRRQECTIYLRLWHPAALKVISSPLERLDGLKMPGVAFEQKITAEFEGIPFQQP